MNKSWFIVLISLGAYYGLKAIFQLGAFILFGFVELVNYFIGLLNGGSEDD